MAEDRQGWVGEAQGQLILDQTQRVRKRAGRATTPPLQHTLQPTSLSHLLPARKVARIRHLSATAATPTTSPIRVQRRRASVALPPPSCQPALARSALAPTTDYHNDVTA